ncbi:MAG: hypothetical protein H0W45_08520 [Acidobacteria bacterium]|nr:hypothetical protein [Acidobacteriota bacterium]
MATKQRKRCGRWREHHGTPINKGRKQGAEGGGRNAENSSQLKTLGTLDDWRRNAPLCRFCGICGIFSPKGRERIGREPKDGSNLHNFQH